MELLFIKLGAVGDVVMALPAIIAAHKTLDHVRITWVCGSSVKPLLASVDGIDEIVEVNDQRLLRGNVFEKIYEVIHLWYKLAGRVFDTVATGHGDARYQMLSWGIRARARRTFSNTSRRWPVPGRYHGSEYVRLLTGNLEPGRTDLVFPTIAAMLPTHLLDAKDLNRNVVVLVPGGARNLLADDAVRRWPVSKYVALAKKLVAANYLVLIAGGAGDEWVSSEFQGIEIKNLIGQTSLLELIGLFQSCQVVVTHDSGPMHLAIMARTKLVALFGPTNPYEKVLPDYPGVRVLWGGRELSCRPCYDGKSYANCSNNLCLADISEDKVFGVITEVLSIE